MKRNLLILLIDKQGDIGNAIILQLQKEKLSFSGVFATKNYSQNTARDILFCPFIDSMPTFPDGDYTHILIVYNGEKNVLEALPGFAQKTKGTNGELFVVVPIRLYTKELGKKLQVIEQCINIIIIGDVFGEQVLQEGTTIADFFTHAKKEEKIVVSGMGLGSTYPVFIDDAVDIITRVIFLKKEKHKILFAFPKHPPTKLSLARMFQKIDPILRIDFIGQEEKDMFELPTDGIYLFDNSYTVEHAVKKLYEKDVCKELVSEGRNVVAAKIARKNTRFFFYRLAFFAFVLFLLPFVSTNIFMGIGAYDITKAKNALIDGDIKQTKVYAARADSFLRIAEMSHFLYKEKLHEWFGDNLSKEKIATSTLLEASAVADAWSEKNMVAITASLRNILGNLQKVQSLPFSTKALSSVVDITGDVLGFIKPKTYLILLQNDMELRPGGGFIGSYAIAKVDKGDVQFLLHDVYDADGQLKGHVEPPFAIRRYLKSVHWYLRDSNFSPDFPKSASVAAFFLKAETDEIVDGIIAVDVSFMKMLVGTFGKIEVADYKETVKADNFYTLVQNHAEKDFFPGSTQKKDFLQSLFRAMQIRFTQKDIPYQQLYAVLLQGIAEKHVLISFSDPSLQNVFAVNNMSSAMNDFRVQKDNILDYVGISEANVGVNKANVGITRRLAYDVVIDKNASVSAKLTIVYKNEKLNNIYAADYKNYLRIIVPKGAFLTGISINGEMQKLLPAVTTPKVYEAKNFTAPKGLEVAVEEERNKMLFGFLVSVPLGKETIVAAEYVLPKKLLVLPSSFAYDLLLYKQPGTDKYPFSFSSQHPAGYNIVSAPQKEIQFVSDMNIRALFSVK